MKFRAVVEAPEPMKGLLVPEKVVAALGDQKRPPVVVTINGHSWRTRVAVMRGRNLIGLSNANRKAAGVATGDRVEVEIQLDVEPRTVVVPADFARALRAAPGARSAFDALSFSHRRAYVHSIETAKKPDTRTRRIDAAVKQIVESI